MNQKISFSVGESQVSGDLIQLKKSVRLSVDFHENAIYIPLVRFFCMCACTAMCLKLFLFTFHAHLSP